MINVAVIGAGYISDYYIDEIKRSRVFNLVSLFDIDDIRLCQASKFHSIPSSTLDDILSDPSIVLVFNLTSIASHYSVTKSCLLSGKHVFSEKPVSTKILELNELYQIATENNLLLLSAPQTSFSTSIQSIYKNIADILRQR